MNIKNKKSYLYETVKKDQEGYLKNSKDWNKKLAKEIAKRENINLNSDHWIVIMFIRKFYFQFNITPSIRMLINSIKEEIGENKSNSIYLFKLFPQGPAKQASKIAGIPKPVKCL
ncbi:sulfur relay protein TusE [Buchnera aphidicola (Diuraphis noxia)]|uniref:Sulfurtransferase n=1 Tax=Buchnera aphidicola subsp. Diuraphis noxia TaxID=118101 RepID=A0A1B2H975_BUCDN|nr:TusE/DsrC/DsvC family sulfur relay protein [Buchnera aphidicola]ANZ22656.1 sulfur relay protein TusE [Buchnera aphidicola (Diuraphis noxia)]